MMTIKYLATFEYKKPKMAELTIKKETPKTITPSEVKDILGRSYVYANRRLLKPDPDYYGEYSKKRLFDDLLEAFDWLIAKQKEYLLELKDTQREAELVEVQLIDLAESARRRVEGESHVQQVS